MRNKTQDALQAEGLRRLVAAQMSREDGAFPENRFDVLRAGATCQIDRCRGHEL